MQKPLNAYEQKQADRRQRLQDRADKKRAEATGMHAEARKMASVIPFGQPILVGHHSEGRDRRYRGRIENKFRKSFELSNQADELERRANTQSTAISSDDPDAVVKLQAKIDAAQAAQDKMKAANRAVRKGDREALKALGFTADQADELFKPDFAGRIGFPSYALTNNNANIKRMKDRLATLQAAPTETTESERAGVRIVENADENRLQLFFDGKPAGEVRAILKSHGFKWAPSQGAWQRQLNNSARYAADQALSKIEHLAP